MKEGKDVKPIKGKIGKAKKQPMEECFASPHGRRIVPKVLTALKVKGEKDAAKKLFGKVCSILFLEIFKNCFITFTFIRFGQCILLSVGFEVQCILE